MPKPCSAPALSPPFCFAWDPFPALRKTIPGACRDLAAMTHGDLPRPETIAGMAVIRRGTGTRSPSLKAAAMGADGASLTPKLIPDGLRVQGTEGLRAAMRASQAEAINMRPMAHPAQAALAQRLPFRPELNPKGATAIRMQTGLMAIPATPCRRLLSPLTFTAGSSASFRRLNARSGRQAPKVCLLKRLPHGRGSALPDTAHSLTRRQRLQHTDTAAATRGRCSEGRAPLRRPREDTRQGMAPTECRT